MKKVISTLVMIVVCLSMFAGNPFKIMEGKQNAKALMKEAAVAVVEYDWSGAMYDNKMLVKDKFAADYDFVVNNC